MLVFDLTLRYTVLHCVTKELIMNYYIAPGKSPRLWLLIAQYIRTRFERTPCIKRTLVGVRFHCNK